MTKQPARWLLFGIVCLGVLLRAYHLTTRSIWFDEAFSWRLAQFPPFELLQRAIADVHPPLYYFLLKLWGLVFGSSVLSLRSLSIVLAALSIIVTYYLVASALRSRGTGLVAATLLALSGWYIPFAWEARMYILGTLLTLISTWCLLEAVKSSQRQVWWWVGYSLTIVALLYTHYYGLFTLASHALWLGGFIIFQTRGRLGEILQARLLWYGVVGAAVIAGLFSPWAPIILRQNSQVQAAFWIPAVDRWSIPSTIYHLFIPTLYGPSHDTWLQTFKAVTPLALLILVWVWLLTTPLASYRRARAGLWLFFLVGTVPFLLSLIVSLAGRSIYQDRYLVFAAVFHLVAVGILISSLPWRSLRWSMVVLVILAFLGLDMRYWRLLNVDGKPGVHAAMRSLMADWKNPEPVLVSSPFVFFPVQHYAREEFADTARPRLYTDSAEVAHFAGGPVLTTADIARPAVLNDTSLTTVWFIDTTGFGGTATELPPDWRRVSRQTFPEVYAYQGDIMVSKWVRK